MSPGDGGAPRIIEVPELDSTSREVMRRAVAGERGPLWIRADRQIAGRGRSGRGWTTPEGNLAASLLFVPGCGMEYVHQISLLAGIGVHDALTATIGGNGMGDGRRLELKWPNDVLAGTAKLGGILTESTTLDGTLVVIIGVGLNVAVAPPIDGRTIACLADLMAAPPTPATLVRRLATHVALWLEVWDRGRGFDTVRAAWLARALPIGAPLTVNAGDRAVSGRFAGLDATGAMQLEEIGGQIRRITYGDVTLTPATERGQ